MPEAPRFPFEEHRHRSPEADSRYRPPNPLAGCSGRPRPFHEVDTMVARNSWWRRTFKRFWRSPRRPYRRWPERSLGLLIESLEDRTLLSSVVFTPNGANFDLSWSGFNAGGGVANAAQMSVNGAAMLILQDPSGEAITLTGAPASWSGSGTTTVMGPLNTVVAIAIDGTAAANPADSFTLANGGGAVNLTGDFTVTGFNMIAVNTSFTIGGTGTTVTLTADATTGTSTLGFGAGVTVMANIQNYRAGNGTGTTAAANLVTNAPLFTDGSGLNTPGTFTYEQDASIAAANFPNPAVQFGGGILPLTYNLTSDGGSITTPATTVNSPSTDLTLDASGALTINDSLTLHALMASAGTSGTGNLTFGAGVTINADTQDYEAGSGTGTTAVADLVTNTPTFLDTAGTAAPVLFIYIQDANIAAATVPQPNQFGGALPTTFRIQSNQGSLTTPTAAIVTSPSTSLTLTAHTAVTINWSTTIGALTVMAGTGITVAQFFSVTGNAGLMAGTDITLAAPLTAGGNVGLMAGGLITESGGGAIDANQLTTSSVTGTTLSGGGTNAVATFNATNSTSGPISFTDMAATGLTISGIMQTGGGAVTISNNGNVAVNAAISASGATVGITSTSGAITGTGAITAAQLTTSSATGTTLNGGGNMVGTFQATNSTSGVITFSDASSPLVVSGITQSGPGNVTVTNTGVGLNITGKITLSGGTLQLTSAGTVNINAAIDPPAVIMISAFADVNINSLLTATDLIQVMAGQDPSTHTGSINVNATGGLTQSSAGHTGIELFTGTTAGSITLAGFLNAQDSVLLMATNNVTETGAGGTITATGFSLLGGTGTFTLGQANVVGTLAGNFTGALTFNDTTALTVGTVLGTSGLNSNGNNITLTVNAGASLLTIGTASNGQSITAAGAIVDLNTGGVTENTNAIITAANLRLQGTGTFTLGQGNAVGTLAGTFTGALTFNDTIALLVGTVLTTNGLNSNGNNITLTVNNGASLLTVGTASNGQSITATGATVDLNAGGITESTNAIITAASLRLQGTGIFTLNQGNVVGTLAGNFTGVLAFTDTTALTVGTVLTTAGLNSNGNNITLTVNAGASLLTIGTASNGQSITATGATVDLNTGGITENTNAIITAANLRLQGTGTFNLNQPNVVPNLAGNFTGALIFNDASANPTGLTVGTVLATVGLTSMNNNITLCNTGDVLLNQPVNAGTNAGAVTVRIKSGGAVTQGTGVGAMGVITADNLGIDAVGSIVLDKFANHVSTFAARGTSVSVRFAGPFALGTVAAAACFTSTITGIMPPAGPGQDITICQDTGTLTITMAINAGTGTVRLVASNGGVTQAAGATITAAALGVRATSDTSVVTGGDIALDLANNSVGTFAALNMDTNRWAIRFLNTNPAGTVVGTVSAAMPCFTMTAGVLDTNGDVTLNSSNGATLLTIGSGSNEGITATGGTVDLFTGGATEATGSIITATNLRLRSAGPGPFTFTLGQTNMVSSTLAGNFFGALTFINNAAITIAPISLNAVTTPDLTSNGGNVTLTLSGGLGLLTINTPTGMGIQAGTGTVDLNVGGATEANVTSIITAASLRLQGFGTFTLNQANVVATIAGNFTGVLTFNDTTALTVGTVLTTSGLNSNGNNITLTVNGVLTIGTVSNGQSITATGAVVDFNAGGVTESTNAIITAASLRLQGTGTFNLNQPNVVATIAGNFTGALTFNDTIALTVGTVLTTNGLNSNGNNITLTVNNGTSLLTIGTASNGQSITGTGATVDLLAGGITENTNAIITAANLRLQGTGTFNLNQPNMVTTLAGNINGTLTFTTAAPLTVGTVLSTSGLTSNANNITLTLNNGLSLLTINTPAGPVQGIVAQGASVDINAGGVTESTATSTITTVALRLQGTGTFNLNQPNAVNVLAGNFTGSLNFADTLALLVGTVLGTAGLTSHGSAITLTLGASLIVNQTINAGTTGNVSITAASSVVFTNDAPVIANAASVQGSAAPPTLIVNYSGMVDTTWTITGANAGTIANNRFIITSSPQAITFTNFGTLVGGAGADTFIFHDGATLSGSIDGGQTTVSGKIDTIDWSQYTTARMVVVQGRATHGVFGTEPSLGAGFTDIDRLIGTTTAASTLTGPDHNNTWTITGVNAGTLTTDYGGGVTSQVSFAGFANLKGGALVDTFVFQNGGQITGNIDGGGVPAGSKDSLDWSQVTTDRVVAVGGFGTLHGYAGAATGVGSFNDIDLVIGSATTMGNTLYGENQSRIWTIGVNSSATNVQGTYAPASGAPVLCFNNFQAFVAGSASDTFNVNATPAGKTIALFGGGGNDTFNLGGTVNSLDAILGAVLIDGGKPASTTPQSQSASVSCPPAPGQSANAHPPVSQTVNWVSGGEILNINDALGAQSASGLTYNLGAHGQFYRATAGITSVSVAFVSIEEVHLITSTNASQTVNISQTDVIDVTNAGKLIPTQTTVQVSGTGTNKVGIYNTGASSALFLTATAGTNPIGITTTGMNSYTKVTVANGSISQVNSGPASILDINASGTSGNMVNLGANDPVTNAPGTTGPNSVTRVTTAGVTINLKNADPTSGLMLTAVSASQINVGLFNKQTTYPPHPLAAAVVNVQGSGVLSFVNDQGQPSAINGSVFRFISATAGNGNLITSPDTTAVYLCSAGLSLPQQSFVAASFLLPNQVNASGLPVAKIVLSSQLAPNLPVQTFTLPPVVASPSFFNPYGFGPPSVAVADVNGDGIPDVIVGAGPGFAPVVTVFDGRTLFNTQGAAPAMLAQFFAYDSTFVGGVYVAAGNVAPETGKNAIITGTGRGGLPIVAAFSLNGSVNPNNPPQVFPAGGVNLIRYFLAYDANIHGGVRVAAGNFNGMLNAQGQPDHDDIVTATGPGDAPNVRIFSGTNPNVLLRSFFAYDPAFRGGVDIAVGKFHTGDAFDDLVTAPGSAGTTQVNIYNGSTLALVRVFSAFPGTFNGVGGIAVDISTGTPRILVGSALGYPAQVVAFDSAGNPVPIFFFDALGNAINDPFFDALGNPISNPTFANHQGVSVGAARSR
jgi:hypothetical protein